MMAEQTLFHLSNRPVVRLLLGSSRPQDMIELRFGFYPVSLHPLLFPSLSIPLLHFTNPKPHASKKNEKECCFDRGSNKRELSEDGRENLDGFALSIFPMCSTIRLSGIGDHLPVKKLCSGHTYISTRACYFLSSEIMLPTANDAEMV